MLLCQDSRVTALSPQIIQPNSIDLELKPAFVFVKRTNCVFFGCWNGKNYSLVVNKHSLVLRLSQALSNQIESFTDDGSCIRTTYACRADPALAARSLPALSLPPRRFHQASISNFVVPKLLSNHSYLVAVVLSHLRFLKGCSGLLI